MNDINTDTERNHVLRWHNGKFKRSYITLAIAIANNNNNNNKLHAAKEWVTFANIDFSSSFSNLYCCCCSFSFHRQHFFNSAIFFKVFFFYSFIIVIFHICTLRILGRPVISLTLVLWLKATWMHWIVARRRQKFDIMKNCCQSIFRLKQIITSTRRSIAPIFFLDFTGE